MQFIVFAAFAMVLSVPEAGPPWPTIRSTTGTLLIVLGQMMATLITGVVYARLVCTKLEREPAWLPAAQRKLAQGNAAIRAILFAGLTVSVYGTDLTRLVRGLRFHAWGRVVPLSGIWGLDDLLILSPFLISIVLALMAIYPADRAVRQVTLELRLWAAAPARPVWSLRKYLSFMLRQHVLIVLAPMLPIVVANAFALRYSDRLRAMTRLPWGEQIVPVVIAGAVFLVAPVLLRYIWHTRPLPPGELRDRLEALCRRVNLRYRHILIWESDGMVVNAAVMGLLPSVRYVLLSDGLLELMGDRNIEAVFGHEAGHVKKRHIEYYLLFAVLSMLVVGGISLLILVTTHRLPGMIRHRGRIEDYLQVLAMVQIVLIWAFGFGWVSRRFERQADLFGARSVTPPGSECDRPCLLHGTMPQMPLRVLSGSEPLSPLVGVAAAAQPAPASDDLGEPVCATAASLFATSLERIAVLNGIPLDSSSWRHGSIGSRIRMLNEYPTDPARSASLDRTVLIIKAFLVVGTLIGLAIAAWLYWPSGARVL